MTPLGLVGCLVINLATLLVGQETTAPTVEITKTDITKIERIRSVDLTLFGIALGDKTDSAQEKARAAGFRTEIDTLSPRPFTRVFDGSKELFAIIDEGGAVVQLTLFNDLAALMPGESSKLFASSIMEAESPLRLQLLGREDSRTQEQPRGTSLTIINISYDKEGIRLTQWVDGKVDPPPVILLVMPAKAR